MTDKIYDISLTQNQKDKLRSMALNRMPDDKPRVQYNMMQGVNILLDIISTSGGKNVRSKTADRYEAKISQLKDIVTKHEDNIKTYAIELNDIYNKFQKIQKTNMILQNEIEELRIKNEQLNLKSQNLNNECEFLNNNLDEIFDNIYRVKRKREENEKDTKIHKSKKICLKASN